MKKYLIIILVFGIILLVGNGYAQTDKDILFRGVEWNLVGDSALDAVAATMPNSTDIKWISLSTNGGSYTTSDGRLVYVGSYQCGSSSFVPDDLAVADYPVSYIQLCFIPSVVDGTVHDSHEESFYVAANYLFSKSKINYIALAFSDIRAKLISLYGMPDEEYSIDDPDRGLCVCKWNGSNDTSVEMRTDAPKEADMDGFSLYYCCRDIGDRIEQLNELPLARSIGSIDGL